MSSLNDLVIAVGTMPHDNLFASVALGAFALSAFAIYAVLTVTKERR